MERFEKTTEKMNNSNFNYGLKHCEQGKGSLKLNSGVMNRVLFLASMLLIFVLGCSSPQELTVEARSNLMEMVKMQLIAREDPNIKHFVSDFSTLGFKTKEGTFASDPQSCQYSTNSQFDKYACGKSYAYGIGAPQIIECNPSGVGNFVWAVATNKNVPEDWRCVCMDANFNINHGRCN